MSATATAFGADEPRLVGRHDSGRSGPLLLVTGAIHGNEPAGVRALKRVFATLAALRPVLRGRIVGLIGNRSALARGERFVASDLNRLWTKAALAKLAGSDPLLDLVEQREQRELLAAIDAELALPHEGVVLLDLHSTSGDSPPFTVLDEDPASRALARELGVPAILGLLRNVDGTVLDFAAARGFACVVLEGGQNEAPRTVDHHEAAVWLMLHAAGLIDDEPRFELARHRACIDASVQGIPDAVEICLRYAIESGERFEMLPGFQSFQRVHQGQLLARGGRSGTREIRAPLGAILLMPRYQGQGQDGFFLARTAVLAAR